MDTILASDLDIKQSLTVLLEYLSSLLYPIVAFARLLRVVTRAMTLQLVCARVLAVY